MFATKLLTIIAVFYCLHVIPVNGSGKNLFEAWKEISRNNANDIQQITKIYNELRQEQQAVAELRTIVERQLRIQNAELLYNVIVAHDTEVSQRKLRDILDNIMEQYDKKLIDDIFTEAFNDVSVVNKLAELPDILWGIYKNGDSKFFEIMLRAQIKLYNIFSVKYHNEKKKYLYKFAYRLKKTKEDPLYKEINFDLKVNLENLEGTLPNNIKYLLFAPYFCLQNELYSKYIYTAVEAKIDQFSRYIWLWHDNLSMDDTGFIKANVIEYNPAKDQQLKVTLKGTKYQVFYYMMPNTNVIAGWDSHNTPMNHIWDIEFLDNDRVTLSQNNYMMCAIEAHDSERRNVGGRLNGTASSQNSECQWRLGECRYKN